MAWFGRSNQRDAEKTSSPRRRARRARALLAKAERAAAEGRIEEAEELLGDALALDRGLVRARLHRATLYLSRDEIEAARGELDLVLAGDEAPPEAWQLAIVTSLRGDRTQSALELVRRGLEQHEEAPALLWLRCEVARRLYWGGLAHDERDLRRQTHWAFEQVLPPEVVTRALDFEESPDESFVAEIGVDEPELAERIRGLRDMLALYHQGHPGDGRTAVVAFRDGHQGTFTGLVDSDPLTWNHFECLEGETIEFVPFARIRSVELGAVQMAMAARLTMTDGTQRRVRIPLLYRHSTRCRDPRVAGGGMTAWRLLCEGVDLVAGLRLLHAEESDFGLETIGRLEFQEV